MFTNPYESMKQNRLCILYFVTIFFFALMPKINAQILQRCGTTEFQEYFLSQHPSLEFSRDTVNNRIFNELNSIKFHNQRTSGGIITIPVVVHLIGDNVIAYSTTKAQDQIDILNQDYGKMSGTNGFGNGVDTKIRFCLANVDPFGDPTNGIVPISGIYPSWVTNNPTASNGDIALKTLSHWPPDRYLNLYVVEQINGGTTAGWTFPIEYYPSYPEFDGITLDYDYFGYTSTPQYDIGRTLTHEIGHWLGLFHTFEKQINSTTMALDPPCFNDDPYLNGDMVWDTPPVWVINIVPIPDGGNYFCNPGTNSCNTDVPDVPDQIENYMDYTPDFCMNMFTQGQADRMNATLNSIRNYTLFSSTSSCNPYHCSNGILDEGETSVDCGGECPPCEIFGGGGGSGGDIPGSDECPTVQFKINGKSTIDIVNVCQPDIVLSPYNYSLSCVATRWKYSIEKSEIGSIASLCTNVPTWQNAQRVYYGLFNNHCSAIWISLFIAVQECDSEKNLIGPEASQNFYIYDSDPSTLNEPSTFQAFNLNSYLPSGFSFQEGKYYKIKVASATYGASWVLEWNEHNGYIRIYKDNLDIQNNANIIHDQFGSNVTIENSTVPLAADIKVVAKTKIEILPNSILESGSYYIDNFDCNNLDQFRLLTSGNNPPYEVQTYSNYHEYESRNIVIPKQNETIKMQNEIIKIHSALDVFPNPNNGFFNVSVTRNEKPIGIKEMQVVDFFGNIIWQTGPSPNNTFIVDISNYTAGMYYVRSVNELGEIEIKKLVKQ